MCLHDALCRWDMCRCRLNVIVRRTIIVRVKTTQSINILKVIFFLHVYFSVFKVFLSFPLLRVVNYLNLSLNPPSKQLRTGKVPPSLFMRLVLIV